MIIETSAIVAIIIEESSADALTAAIAAEPVRRMSAVNLVEASILRRQFGPEAVATLDQLLVDMDVQIGPFDMNQADAARIAYFAMGRGSGHSAGLNFGDCFSYALAKITGEPLVCTGKDFASTDIEMVPWQ